MSKAWPTAPDHRYPRNPLATRKTASNKTTANKSAAKKAAKSPSKPASAKPKTRASRPDAADATARRQRALQEQVDRKDAKPAKKAAKKAAQAGARRQPENPLPEQHLRKPGNEHDLAMEPRYLAPDYRGSGKLEGMTAIVTGGDSGIGRAVAILFAREGADVAVLYLNEHQDAQTTCEAVEAEGRRCLLISGDVRDSGFATPPSPRPWRLSVASTSW